MRICRGLEGLRISVCVLSLSLSVSSSSFCQEKPQLSQSQAKTKKRKVSVAAKPFVLVGAGDIASCKDLSGAEATADLIEKIPGEVFAAGDLAYEKGTAEEFKNCYASGSRQS